MKKKRSKLAIVENDEWLLPYEQVIVDRHQYAIDKEKELIGNGTLCDFSNGHLYFGLHREKDCWGFREWAPNATRIVLVGDFNQWTESSEYELTNKGKGIWEIVLPENSIKHGDLYKLHVYWNEGGGERIPSYANRVVQDETTKIFSAQVWCPVTKYKFKTADFKPNTSPLLIYECHIGMAQEEEKVGTFSEFRLKTLPRIKKAGYNAIQIMALQEHPYYGSFGYHVSNLFALSSRFGTPEEFKQLVDDAHAMGIAVIMDIVHSHAVKNEIEGLGNFAGDPFFF